MRSSGVTYSIWYTQEICPFKFVLYVHFFSSNIPEIHRWVIYLLTPSSFCCMYTTLAESFFDTPLYNITIRIFQMRTKSSRVKTSLRCTVVQLNPDFRLDSVQFWIGNFPTMHRRHSAVVGSGYHGNVHNKIRMYTTVYRREVVVFT